eukprot:TRINITY_DN3515_c0_g1_i4.p1 TRINITY_DN3515_c0_g1~~TRINITY_DN3515_c0_g1_i4.p1  ORF type:complete len:622 (+),score=80.75 TRINITY_DN3515_c0_g1_i4:31-1866(+)
MNRSVSSPLTEPEDYPNRKELISESSNSVVKLGDRYPQNHNEKDHSTTNGYTRVSYGVCGLQNLGNTCFMNSGLQCLAHTGPLTEYFLKNKYKEELNKTNPLGMKGRVASAYATLLRDIWSGKYGYVTPSNFKLIVGQFAPQFSGYRQHDSQEFVAFLLDGLHEDLNRVIDKPYITTKDFDNRPDDEIAREQWSTLRCPETNCKNVSVTFDPFMYLSLPLPLKTTLKISLIFVPSNPCEKRSLLFLKIEPLKIKDLKEAVAKKMGLVSHKQILIGDMSDDGFYFYKDNKNLDSFLKKDPKSTSPKLYAFALPRIIKKEEVNGDTENSRAAEKKTNTVYVPVFHRLKKDNSIRILGCPFVLCLELDQIKTTMDFYSKISDYLVQSKIIECPRSDEYLLTVYTIESPSGRSIPTLGIPIRGFSGRAISIDWLIDKYEKLIAQRLETHSTVKVSKLSTKSSWSLYDCLDLFLNEEKLGKDNKWYCPKCKNFTKAIKKFDVWDLPEILIIHLKRFKFDKYHREKIEMDIDFPIKDLDLSGYVSKKGKLSAPPLYDLYGISIHMGSLGGGHYTAFAKNHINQHWYLFNDDKVTKLSSDKALQKRGAYLLFYERQKK